MAQNDKIQLFEDKRIRTAWDEEKEEWYFSIVDVVAVLTDQPDQRHAAKYWSVLKTRLKKEGSQLTTNCSQLQFVKELRFSSQENRSSLRSVPKLSQNQKKSGFFHSQFASFFRFMAANLSLTQCETRAKPLWCV